MSQNAPVSGESAHIAFFGLRNAGKSSVVNAVTGQKLAIVSDVLGTTTDPVKKAMELPPIGPVVIIDTPGIDDAGELGALRVQRTLQILETADVAILVTDAARGMQAEDYKLLDLFQKYQIAHLIVYNKSDLLVEVPAAKEDEIYVSAQNGTEINALKDRIAQIVKHEEHENHIVADLLHPGDMVVLVTPIDASAPKGRLILPQQQTIRDILEAGAMCAVTKETELAATLEKLRDRPAMVITDSQAFALVDQVTPDDVLLTSFSILFARYKGDLETLARGAFYLDRLQDGDHILISEGCTHHRQCGDLGTEKLPKWLKNYTKKDLRFSFTSGGEFPEDVSEYDLVIHCGGCMLSEREMKARIRHAQNCDTPITNYGVTIAHIHGILERALSPFPDLLAACRKAED